MATNEIRTVELTRRIRDRHAEALRDASAEERIRFYREKAKSLGEAVEARRREVASTPS